MYKVLAKVLANRLQRVIGSVITESHLTFVKRRQNLDGIISANEVVDDSRMLKMKLLLFKVDYEKAFDLVDWNYFEVVMRKMNFTILWGKWITEYVSTTITLVFVNRSPMDELNLITSSNLLA